MLVRIRSFVVRTRPDLEEFVQRREEWYPLDRDHPVLGCVTIHPLSTPSKPLLHVTYYARPEHGQSGPRGRRKTRRVT